MRTPSLRRTAVLGALALALPLAATAASPASGAAPSSASAVGPPAAQLPTSWPAVPVAERLQPWLARQLATGAADPLRVMVSGETTAAATAAARGAGLQVHQIGLQASC